MSTSHSSSESDIQPSPNNNGGRLNVSSSYHHQQIPDNQLPPVGHSLQNLTEFIHNQNVELSNLVSTTTTHPESSDSNNSNNNNNNNSNNNKHDRNRTENQDDDDDNDDGCPFVYRFIRLNPRYDATETIQLLTNEIATQNQQKAPIPVPWLDPSWGFYALPGNTALASLSCFQMGRIYGMDVSSGAAVAALLSNQYDQTQPTTDMDSHSTDQSDHHHHHHHPLRVLDLCCCPGLKLCAMADVLQRFHDRTTQSPNQVPNNTTTTTTTNNNNNTNNNSHHSTSTIVGVDNSHHRMALCKKILHKYHFDPETSGRTIIGPSSSFSSSSSSSPILGSGVTIRLYCQDGTTFGQTNGEKNHLVLDSTIAQEEQWERRRNCNTTTTTTAKNTNQHHHDHRKRMNKSARARERKRLNQLAWMDIQSSSAASASSNKDHSISLTMEPFDRVLVDAECSTDGSLRHVKRRIEKIHGDDDNNDNDNNTNRPKRNRWWMDDQHHHLAELIALQRRLIASGFRLLKPGGTMVYSTCSLSNDQNEGVVQWLLDQYTHAFLIPIHFPLANHSQLVVEGNLAGTVRFLPNLSRDVSELHGDGFFLAKLGKKREE